MKVLTAVLAGLMAFGGLAGSAVGVTKDYEGSIYAGIASTAAGLCLFGRGITKELDEEAERIERENRIRMAAAHTDLENDLNGRRRYTATPY